MSSDAVCPTCGRVNCDTPTACAVTSAMSLDNVSALERMAKIIADFEAANPDITDAAAVQRFIDGLEGTR